MTPEVQLFKPPAGAEVLETPDELARIRSHIIYMAAHLMKLYGVGRLLCNPSLIGVGAVTSPTFELMEAFTGMRPYMLQLTHVLMNICA